MLSDMKLRSLPRHGEHSLAVAVAQCTKSVESPTHVYTHKVGLSQHLILLAAAGKAAKQGSAVNATGSQQPNQTANPDHVILTVDEDQSGRHPSRTPSLGAHDTDTDKPHDSACSVQPVTNKDPSLGSASTHAVTEQRQRGSYSSHGSTHDTAVACLSVQSPGARQLPQYSSQAEATEPIWDKQQQQHQAPAQNSPSGQAQPPHDEAQGVQALVGSQGGWGADQGKQDPGSDMQQERTPGYPCAARGLALDDQGAEVSNSMASMQEQRFGRLGPVRQMEQQQPVQRLGAVSESLLRNPARARSSAANATAADGGGREAGSEPGYDLTRDQLVLPRSDASVDATLHALLAAADSIRAACFRMQQQLQDAAQQ